jgi:6-phosphofructokinase
LHYRHQRLSNPKLESMAKKKVALLTGGGDAPGLNGVIESFVRAAAQLDMDVIGFRHGFEGVFTRQTLPLSTMNLVGLHAQAGTTLGTSNRSSLQGREAEFLAQFRTTGAQGLIACGGDGTFEALAKLQGAIPVIGIPKTIDNDLSGTEITFGYDTACSVVAENADALRATAQAHRRIIVVETMGRTAGWIALGGGLACYAEGILIPERPFVRAELKTFLQSQKKLKESLILVVAEGAMARGEAASVAFAVADSPQKERFGGFAERLARWIEAELQWESRHVVLGHLQRSRPPTTTDRFLTLAMGIEGARLAHQNQWQKGVAYREGRVQTVDLQEFMRGPRLVTPEHRWVKLAQGLGIFI